MGLSIINTVTVQSINTQYAMQGIDTLFEAAMKRLNAVKKSCKKKNLNEAVDYATALLPVMISKGEVGKTSACRDYAAEKKQKVLAAIEDAKALVATNKAAKDARTDTQDKMSASPLMKVITRVMMGVSESLYPKYPWPLEKDEAYKKEMTDILMKAIPKKHRRAVTEEALDLLFSTMTNTFEKAKESVVSSNDDNQPQQSLRHHVFSAASDTKNDSGFDKTPFSVKDNVSTDIPTFDGAVEFKGTDLNAITKTSPASQADMEALANKVPKPRQNKSK